MAKSGAVPLYFQYGDFRIYSASGRIERSDRFPQSVRRKAIGKQKHIYYLKLREMFKKYLDSDPEGENPSQGYGDFSLVEDYATNYKNTRIGLLARKDSLKLHFRIDYPAFGKLPDIIESLSPNMRNAIFNLYPCNDNEKCSFKCRQLRIAVFDENIYPPKTFVACKMNNAETEIDGEEDIKSAEILFAHIAKCSECKK